MATKQQSKVKTAAAVYPIPGTRDEADRFIFMIGEERRIRAVLQAELDFMLAELKQRFEENAAPHLATEEDLTQGLQDWCEANRNELLDGDSKTAKFGNGEVAWRNRPASVTLRGIEKIIAAIKRRPSVRTLFLRIKTEVNKESMLDHPKLAQKIPGVTIASAGEDFIVTPLSAELEQVAS
ncbi:MAG: host-nuclease inhibitor Gam family protein [Candidatus Binatus sp.]